MKTSRSRSTSRSRWRRRPALASSRRSRAGVSGGLRRGGRGGQDGARVGAGQPAAGQLGERGEGGRVEVFEQVADLVADLLTRPHRVLLGAGQHPDGLGQLGVGGQRPVRAGIGAHNVGQQHRVGGIGFGPRHRIPGPIPRGGQRVDRIDHPAGRAQRGHPQSAVGFDPHRDRVLGGVAGLGPTASTNARSRPRRCRPARAPPHAHRRRPQRRRDVLWPNRFHNTSARCHHSFDRCVEHVTGGLTRRPNRRTQRSVISLAVRDSSTPQDLVLSKSSRLGNNHREVNPAAGSGNGIPPPHQDLPPGAPFFRKTSNAGNNQASPGSRPVQEQTPVTTTSNPSLLND